MYTPNVFNLISDASNIKIGENPDYTNVTFLNFFPQFKEKVPDEVLKSFINLANANINIARYKSFWNMAMNFYVAHFLTIYISECQRLGANSVGMITSKSVDGISVSYDTASIMNDLDGWGGYKQTSFGIQFATIAKLAGLGGIYVV